MSSFHTPVLKKEVVEALNCSSGGVYVDGTVGGGGHAREILEKSSPGGILIGIDLDDDALAEASANLKSFGHRKKLFKGNFADMAEILAGLHIEQVDGILLDLGVSSHQLDTASRGFSFSLDAPLDMRMDNSGGLNAYDLVNSLPEDDLKKIIKEYGEEMMASRIVRAIAAKRKSAPIHTTRQLADIVFQAVPPAFRHRKIHPATRTFQALRIAVNEELVNVRKGIEEGVDLLKGGGRIAVISFHSLEDRIVKDIFRSLEKGCICPPDFPVCTCRQKPKLRVLNRKPITAAAEEIKDNVRARSAKLRSAEKV